MPAPRQDTNAAGGTAPRRLFCYAPGLWLPGRVRRILTLAGLRPVPGHALHKPGPDDMVGVWGHSPLTPRGEDVARASGAPLVRIEDAFLRSLRPGRSGDAPLGLLIDRSGGVHFDASRTSMLEDLCNGAPLD
ncbi:MAG: capsular polysaccharide biosynthesis protein, partial [Gemmobacter sp.]|nr:capsular polysaccharide biosynthesis protein [Gemmobacter sp.]